MHCKSTRMSGPMANGEGGEESSEELERQAFARVIHAFRNYTSDAEPEVQRWASNFLKLPSYQQKMLPTEPEKFTEAQRCLQRNGAALSRILAAFDSDAAPSHLRVDSSYSANETHQTSPLDAEKVRYVLKNLARDWSAEGRAERSEAYEPMLEELETLVPICSDGSTFRPDVLIPGAGLGRMCLEAVRRGYNAQGSEFSYFMLLASSFMLNSSSPAEPLVVHPWMHTSLNHLSDESMLREVLCPEVDPVEYAGNTDATMSMCAGDFVEVYTKAEQENSWDAILSCFFLDTAQNFVDYLEAMYNALKPGGVLINFGPLLFHWAEHASEMASNDISIEASWETVKSVALQVGFQIRREEMRWCTYTTDRNSMLQSMYNVVFATFVKPSNGPRRVYSNAAAMQGIPQHCDSANAEQPNGDPNERESVDHQNKHH